MRTHEGRTTQQVNRFFGGVSPHKFRKAFILLPLFLLRDISSIENLYTIRSADGGSELYVSIYSNSNKVYLLIPYQKDGKHWAIPKSKLTFQYPRLSRGLTTTLFLSAPPSACEKHKKEEYGQQHAKRMLGGQITWVRRSLSSPNARRRTLVFLHDDSAGF